MSQHETRTALVTGGLSGLGAAAAKRLREDGVKVFTVDIADGADFQMDVTDFDAVAKLPAQLPRIDILVTSAGVVGPNIPLLQTTEQQWKSVFDINVLGTASFIKAFAPGMVENHWGRIVTFASMAAKDGNPNLSVYSATKAAVVALTKSVGKELATTGVLVNAIAPAVIETPMNQNTSAEVLAHLASLIPMKRIGKAEEVAELVAWLCSDKVSFSTGAVYDISGGRATY
ncbi:MAG: SDR family oxidoreductase [Microbacteriaceae bacterium]|jgi:3-oxoacyl-[acyl-carrier protein] reductase|nr:SDR family oxidoreductase [Microbacteriaceae bacterium]